MKVKMGMTLIIVGILGLVIEFLIWVQDIWVTIFIGLALCIISGVALLASCIEDTKKEEK
jgi:uncharacterized membrane protein